MQAKDYGANASDSSPVAGNLVTVHLTERQARFVREQVQCGISWIIRNTVSGDEHLTSRADMDGLRATFNVREGWIDQLEQPAGELGTLTWTAPRAEIAAVAVDLVAKGMHASVVDDILEDGGDALSHYAARLWLDMADAALTIRAQLGADVAPAPEGGDGS